MSIGPLRETVALWQRLENVTTLEESLRSNKMSGFLIVEDSKEAIETLNAQIDATMAELKALDAKIPETMTKTKGAFQTAIGEVASLRLKADPKISLFGLRDPVKKASKVLGDVSTFNATVVSASQIVMGSLKDFDIDLTSADGLQKVIDSERKKNPNKKIPGNEKFLAGIKKAWQPPAGIANAVKGFLGALGIGRGSNFFGLTAEDFAKDLMLTSPASIQSMLASEPAKNSQKAGGEEISVLDDKLAAAGLDSKVMNPEASAAEAKPGAAEAKPGAVEAGESEKEPATKGLKKWSEIKPSILQDFGKLSNKEKRDPQKVLKALANNKAFRDAVGDSINLGENFQRGHLKEMLISPKGNTTLPPEESAYDEDDMVRYRWMKMAGLKDGDKE